MERQKPCRRILASITTKEDNTPRENTEEIPALLLFANESRRLYSIILVIRASLYVSSLETINLPVH